MLLSNVITAFATIGGRPIGVSSCDPATICAFDTAMVEHDRGVAENKIAVAGDEAIAKILARCSIDEKRVLIAENSDVIEKDAIGAGSNRQPRRDIFVRN